MYFLAVIFILIGFYIILLTQSEKCYKSIQINMV